MLELKIRYSISEDTLEKIKYSEFKPKISQIIKIFDKKTIGFLSPNEIISSLGNK